MAGTSSAGGYLTPAVSSPPLEGVDLDAVLQAFVVGVTGLAGGLVRPRCQPTPPKMPERDTNWCAIGVETQDPDDGPAITHDPAGTGTDTLARHERVILFLSFYGPLGQQNAAIMRDGISVPQNVAQLAAYGLKLRTSSGIVTAPELISNLWFKRYDYTVTFARKAERAYGVQNLLSAPGGLVADTTPPLTRNF